MKPAKQGTIQDGAWQNAASTFLLASALTATTVLAFSAEVRAGTLQQPSGPQRVFLPSVLGPPSAVSPAGNYDCQEHEYGMLDGGAYQVQLHADGTSTYALWGDVRTGTWTYVPSTNVLTFTNFRWITATYASPTRFYAEWRSANDAGTPTRDVFCWRP